MSFSKEIVSCSRDLFGKYCLRSHADANAERFDLRHVDFYAANRDRLSAAVP